MLKRLSKDIECHGDLKDQSEFRKGGSTTKVLLKIDKITQEVRNGFYTTREFCLVVTLHVLNAFNNVGWSHILQILRESKIYPYILSIVISYLDNRMIRLSRDGSSS